VEISLAGALVCVGILLIGIHLQGPVIVGLLASLAFGSTSIATLGTLGGSSPLIFTVFVPLLLLSAIVRRNFLRDLRSLFAHHRLAWIVCALAVYAVASATIFPRLFAGATTVFVASRVPGSMGVFEVPLGPVSGNVAQTGYFLLGAVAFLALSVRLVRGDHFAAVRTGFFTLAALTAALGLIDLAGKLVGAGDILLPIRTAKYSLLTEASEAGFWRIVGAHSEASAFAGAALTSVAFTFTYWRRTRSHRALGLSIVLLALLILSTSSTAYVGGLVLAVPLIVSLTRAALNGRISPDDILLCCLLLLCIVTVLSLFLYDPRSLDPFLQLFQTMVLDKPMSHSGQERTYWTYQSVKAFFDTAGVGVGFGSSRAASWPVAVISQLGVLGTLLLLPLILPLVRFRSPPAWSKRDPQTSALTSGARASALAGLVAVTINGGTADPGLLFFVSLAVVLAGHSVLHGEQGADTAQFEARPYAVAASSMGGTHEAP
jgi:hypothetical protein